MSSVGQIITSAGDNVLPAFVIIDFFTGHMSFLSPNTSVTMVLKIRPVKGQTIKKWYYVFQLLVNWHYLLDITQG